MKIIVCKIKQQNKLETDDSERIHSKNGSSYVKHKVDIYSGMQKFGNPLQNLWKCE